MGLAFSRRRITLSTSGIVPLIEEVGQLGIQLAISLHAVSDKLRSQIVPINNQYPLHQLLEACRAFTKLPNALNLTFEYVMLDGVNDSDADARELVRLVGKIPCTINLIPFNSWPGAPFTCSSDARIETFQSIIDEGGIQVTVRWPRGGDILAACGQLRSIQESLKNEKKKGLIVLPERTIECQV